MLLPDWLARCAENRPAHLAVQCGQAQWSFVELDRQATRLARQLATIGVQEGHRVARWLPMALLMSRSFTR